MNASVGILHNLSFQQLQPLTILTLCLMYLYPDTFNVFSCARPHRELLLRTPPVLHVDIMCTHIMFVRPYMSKQIGSQSLLMLCLFTCTLPRLYMI